MSVLLKKKTLLLLASIWNQVFHITYVYPASHELYIFPRAWKHCETVPQNRIVSCSLSITHPRGTCLDFYRTVSRFLSETFCYKSAGRSIFPRSQKCGDITGIRVIPFGSSRYLIFLVASVPGLGHLRKYSRGISRSPFRQHCAW